MRLANATSHPHARCVYSKSRPQADSSISQGRRKKQRAGTWVKGNKVSEAGKLEDPQPLEQLGFLQLALAAGKCSFFGKKPLSRCTRGWRRDFRRHGLAIVTTDHPKYAAPFPPIQNTLFHTTAKLGLHTLGFGIELSLQSTALMSPGV